MTNPRSFVALGTAAIGPDNRQWIEVMPTCDDASNGGKKFVVTPDDLETYAQSIRDQGGQTVIDYDHEGASDTGSTKASGWFTGQAEVRATDRGQILYAEVQWTPAAARAIGEGEYRFISPEFSFHDRDAKTGLLSRAKEMIAATLTNRPFFRELAPVATRLTDAQIDSIAVALAVDRDLVVAAAAAATGQADGQSETTPNEGVGMTLLSALRDRLKTADDATEETILATLDERLTASESSDEEETADEADEAEEADVEKEDESDDDSEEIVEARLLKHSNTQLAKRVEQLEIEAQARTVTADRERRDKAVADALKDGRIMAAEHDMYRVNLDINEAAAMKVLASLPTGRVPVSERGQSPAPNQVQELAWFPQFATKKEA